MTTTYQTVNSAIAAFSSQSALHPLATPRLVKASISIGIGKYKAAGGDEQLLIEALRLITGQQPATTQAKKAIAGFKVREGQTVGIRVTLRGKRVIDFYERLVNVALPRVRDFRGIDQKSVTGTALSFAISDSSVWPELTPDHPTFGMNVSFVSTSPDQQTTLAFFQALGFPFKKG